MKKLRTLLLPLVMCGLALLVGCENRLFSDGQSQYCIALCADASPSEQTAASELQSYIEQIAGITLPIKPSGELLPDERHIFIGFNEEYASQRGVARPDDESQQYTYCNVGRNLWIYGGKRWGTMYGVYSFLENELGVRWYSPDYTKVVPHNEWGFRSLNHSESPDIMFRFNDAFAAERDYAWMGHNKCNSIWSSVKNNYGGLVGFWGGHTFAYFVPSKEFFATHPEYFALRDGERVPYGQLCLSNPEVIEICKERMIKVIADNPDYWVYSLSQDDHQFMCQCEKCRAIEEQYGGHSGLLIWFVNQVADAVKTLYPNKYISTFAYQYTRKAPEGISPRDNVVIRLCSIECCFAHPMEQCEHNESFIRDIKAWSELASRLYIWDYVVNFRQYIAPCPNFDALAANIRTFQKYNTIGLHEEGQYESVGGAFADLKSWVLAKLMWNPNLDTMALVEEFIADYYGPAAPYVQQYFDLCQGLIDADKHMGLFFLEDSPIYTDEFVAEARKILSAAVAAVEGESEQMRHRVDLVNLQILYLYMMRQPQEALADGTCDYVFDFIRRHKIMAIEWNSVENFINWYSDRYLGIKRGDYRVPIDR
ncbi:MAG: DUF4838 domain-containing protein [Alistipes sp.]|nr:DUF4838 domain-containing protein [Alistipes sp.]